MTTVNRTAGGIRYDTSVKEASRSSPSTVTPTRTVGSGDAKLAAYKAATSSSSVRRAETPQEYRAKVEQGEAVQTSPAPSTQPPTASTPRSVTGLDMLNPNNPADNAVIRERVIEQQAMSANSSGGSRILTTNNKQNVIISPNVTEYPTPYSPNYTQRVEMGKLVSGLQPSTTQAQDRRTLIGEQNTMSYIPGQPTASERLRDADRREGMDAMNLGRYEGVASRYEGAVGRAVAPAIGSSYKSARFIGGVAEGIAYTPVAIPRMLAGLATNPTATAREIVLGTTESVIADPARGTGQIVGAFVAGKGISKGAKATKAYTQDIAKPTFEYTKLGVKRLALDDTAQLNPTRKRVPAQQQRMETVAETATRKPATISPELQSHINKAYQRTMLGDQVQKTAMLERQTLRIRTKQQPQMAEPVLKQKTTEQFMQMYKQKQMNYMQQRSMLKNVLVPASVVALSSAMQMSQVQGNVQQSAYKQAYAQIPVQIQTPIQTQVPINVQSMILDNVQGHRQSYKQSYKHEYVPPNVPRGRGLVEPPMPPMLDYPDRKKGKRKQRKGDALSMELRKIDYQFESVLRNI